MNKIKMATCAFMRSVVFIIGTSTIFCSSAAFAVDENIVDILVIYEDAAAQKAKAGIETYVNQVVAYSNKAFESSDMNIRLRLVHSQKVDVANVGNVAERDLSNLTDDKTIAQLRDEYGADLVAMLAPATNIGGGLLCGIAWANGSNYTAGQFSSQSKDLAYSMTGIECGAATFAHEVGHNIGLGHDHKQGDRGGVFNYGLGHGIDYRFSTIMTYPHHYGLNGTVDYFSNPRLNLCDGEPCGIPEGSNKAADAARAVNQVSDQVALWRATVVPTNGTTPNPDPNDPGTNPDPNDPGTNPDPNDPGTNPDPNDPGTNPDPNDPGTNPDPNDPGTNPDPNDPGTNPGNDPDSDNGQIAVDGVALSPVAITTRLDDTNQLNPIFTPTNPSNRNVTYTSKNNDVAFVNNSGLVLSRGIGETIISVTTQDGQHSAAIKIKVVGDTQNKPTNAKGDSPFSGAGSFSHLLLGLLGLLAFRRKAL